MKFKAGKYFVGDPCYVIRNDEWEDILKYTQFFGAFGIGQWGGFWKGYKMFSASTAYGDGCYTDNEGREYGVDAGMLGIVPYEYITEFGDIDCGNIIEFEKDFEVEMIDKGVFKFGSIVIDTLGADEDEESFCLDCGRLLDEVDYTCWYCDEEE